MADYDIERNTLASKKSELEELKTGAEDIYNELNSCYIGTISDPELTGIKSKLKEPIERLKKGYSNSNTWYNNYTKDLDSLESELSSFSGTNLTSPTEFGGEFTDMFGKRTMPIIKTGGDIHANAVKEEPVVFSVEVPDSIKQSAYTVTCYGEGGWYLGGGSTPTAVASGTNQKSVHEAWKADGCRYKDGIAVMNVNGEDHYLIATASTFGKVGDSVTVKLDNGQTIKCVIADQKSSGDSNYTKYGHSHGSSVNILEFEVDRNVYNSKGNPNTSGWGLEWDSSSDVNAIDNHGSIL